MDAKTEDRPVETADAPAAPASREEKLPDGSVKVTLLKPTTALGREITELVFREPTGGDIAKYGDPVSLDMSLVPPKISFFERAMTAQLANLGNVPVSTIEKMHGADWKTCAWAVAPFFMPDLIQLYRIA